MGLFDNNKKKRGGDDFDSPVEQIDLSSTGTTESPQDSSAASSSAAEPKAVAPEPRAAARSADYGIDDAIALMRTLPADNVELVVRVVKHTLESTNIEIKSIIADASQKQERIESRAKVLKSEIADLEQEIETRRKEIDELEADNKETTQVKERLLLAQKLDSGESAPAQSLGGSKPGSGPLGKPNEAGRRSRSPSTSPPPPPKSSSAGAGADKSVKHTIVPKK